MQIVVNRITYILFLIIIALLVFGFFHSNLNGDSLYIEVFQHEFLRDISLGDRYLQMPASAYFPDQLVYFFSRLLFPIPTTLFIVAAVKVLLLASAIYFFCRRGLGIENAKSYLFVTVTIAVLIVPFISGLFPLFRIEMNHFSAVFFSLFLVGIILKPLEVNNFLNTFTAFFIGLVSAISSPASVLILGILGGSIVLVTRWEFIRPIPLKSCISRYKMLFFKKDVITFIALSVGLVFGYLLYINFINPGYLGERTWESIALNSRFNSITSRVGKSFDNLKDTFASILLNHVTIFVIIAGFVLNNINNVPSKIKSIYISLLIAFPLTYLAFAAAGGILDTGYHRYFYALQILAILLALYVFSKLKNISLKGILLFLVVLSAVAFKNDFKIDAQQFSQSLNIPEETKHLPSCINENIRLLDNEKRVVVGVMNYWYANISKVQIVDNRIDIFTMSPAGGGMLWMQNIYTLNSVIDRFYFAVRNDERHLFPIHEQETINCSEGGEWSLLSYGSNNQSAVKFVKSYSSYLLAQLDLSIPKSMWHGNWLPSTATEQQKLHGVTKSEGPGFAHYGPYIALDKGKYYAEIFYSLETRSINSKYRIEVGHLNKDNTFHTIASADLSQGSGLISRIEFSTSPDDNFSPKYEVRTWIDEGVTMYLNHLTIAESPTKN